MPRSFLRKINPLPFSRGQAKAWIRSLRSDIRLQWKEDEGAMKITLRKAWETRSSATLHLMLEALDQLQADELKSINVSVYCTDHPPQHLDLVIAIQKVAAFLRLSGKQRHHILTYASADGDKRVRLVPDFIFYNWPQVGIANFDQLAASIISASSAEPTYPSLFWAGAASHSSRKHLLTLKNDSPLYDFREIIWDRQDPNCLRSSSYVSLIDHVKFKYLLDVEGNGYSGRVKLLMFTRRPIFLQDRPYKEYFYSDLKPYVHYIPVKRDFSDLQDQLTWAEVNPEQCQLIANQALDYARLNFSTAKAVQCFANCLRELD